MEQVNLFTQIQTLSITFVVMWLLFKLIIALSAPYRVDPDKIQIMKKKIVISRAAKFLFIIFLFAIWIGLLYEFADMLYKNKITSSIDEYVLFSIVVLSIANASAILRVLKSLINLISSIMMLVKQNKNTTYYKLLNAIDKGDSKAIIFNYKLLNQGRYNIHTNDIILTDNYWLIVLATLIRAGEIKEAEELSKRSSIGGRMLISQDTPLKKERRINKYLSKLKN